MRVLHGSRETIVDKEIDLEGLRTDSGYRKTTESVH